MAEVLSDFLAFAGSFSELYGATFVFVIGLGAVRFIIAMVKYGVRD